MSQEQIQVPKGWKEVTIDDCISDIFLTVHPLGT